MPKQLYLPDEQVAKLKQSERAVARTHKAYLKAVQARRETFREAVDAGMTYYGISKALGGTPSENRVARIAQAETDSD